MQKTSISGQVIIIDDDQLVRDFAMHTIEYGINRKVAIFDSGFLAWQYIQSQPQQVDIIIADANIPEMDGLELLEQLKRNYPEKIFIITTSNPGHELTASQLGADAFLLKPFDADDLFTLLQHFIYKNNSSGDDKVAVLPINGAAD